jgi:hypothetical protein
VTAVALLVVLWVALTAAAVVVVVVGRRTADLLDENPERAALDALRDVLAGPIR